MNSVLSIGWNGSNRSPEQVGQHLGFDLVIGHYTRTPAVIVKGTISLLPRALFFFKPPHTIAWHSVFFNYEGIGSTQCIVCCGSM